MSGCEVISRRARKKERLDQLADICCHSQAPGFSRYRAHGVRPVKPNRRENGECRVMEVVKGTGMRKKANTRKQATEAPILTAKHG